MKIRTVLKVVLASMLAVILIAAAAIYWVVSTPGGAQLVLGRAAAALGKGAKIEGVEGALGARLRIASIVIDQPDLYVRIEGLEIDSSPFNFGELVVHRLFAREIEVRTASTKAAARVPVSFKAPYPVKLEDGRIGLLRLGKLPRGSGADTVLRDIVVQGEGDKSRWKIAQAAVATEFGTARVSGTLGNASPFAVDLDGDFAGTIQEREVRVSARAKGTLAKLEANVRGEVAGIQATALAVLEPFATAPLKSLALEARDVDLARLAESLPHTRLTVSAKLVPEGEGVAGTLRATNAEPGSWDQQRLPVDAASGRIVASTREVRLTGVSVALAGGGSATGQATIRKGSIEANLEVAGLDLAALHRGLQKTNAAGRIAVVSSGGAQRFEAALKDPRFTVEGRAGIAARRLDIETARITTGGGAVVAKGGVALEGRQEFRFEGRGEHFDPSAFVKMAPGDLNFTFAAAGTLAGGAAGEVKVDLAPSTLAGEPASGRIVLAGDRGRIANADVAIAVGEARLDARGSFGRSGDAMDISFQAPNLSVFAKPFGIALAGRADGTARLTGTFDSPSGRVAVNGANLALPSNVYLRALAVRVEAGTQPDSPIDASVQAQGIAVGKENPPTAIAEAANATLKGTRGAHRLEFDARRPRDTTVRGALQGGVDPRSRELAWNGRVESFAMQGRGAFTLAAPASLFASASRIELGESMMRGEWGDVNFAVTRWTPRTLDLKGSTAGVRIQSLARSLRLEEVPRSSLVIAAAWDIHAADTFDGTLDVRRVSGDMRVGEPPLGLGLRSMELRFEAKGGRTRGKLDISGDRIGRVQGEGSALIVPGDKGWEFARTEPIDAHVVAEIPNLESLAPWLGPEAKLGGQLDANITVSGTGADPSVNGVARASNLVLREPQSGFEVSEGEIALRMSGRSIAIERFVAKTPWRVPDRARETMRRVSIPPEGGAITASGSIDLAARRGAIRVKADKVPVMQLQTRFAALSGEASLEAGDGGLVASGRFKADGGWIGALAAALPSVAEDVVVIRASQPAAPEEAKREPMRIDLQLALDDRVYFQGRGLDTRLDGELRVAGEIGSPLRASGRIRTVEGSYDGYGQKLQIERGVLTFNGPLDNPQLDVLALRKGLPVEAGVEIYGTTTRPRVRLVSRPEVPEPEKLAWLVLGRGASDSSTGDAALMLATARALLGENRPGEDLNSRLGIDEVKIGRSNSGSVLGVLPESTVAGRTGSPSAADVVSLGKRLNHNLQVDYEQGLADAEGTLKLTWIVTRQFQLLVRAGYLPGLDAVYRWTFK